ncbi:MAG: acylphosphatase [Candidatus Bathyarchaeia archaeon]
MPNSRAHVFVEGEVQGIGFRNYVAKHAMRLDIKGWVRNLHDGRVEAVFEGEKEPVQQLLVLAAKGPTFARVKKLDTSWENPISEFNEFVIAH